MGRQAVRAGYRVAPIFMGVSQPGYDCPLVPSVARVEMDSSEMAHAAKVCLHMLGWIRQGFNETGTDNATDRVGIARPLLASSIDHGIALTKLLSLDRPYFAYPAVALFRPQLEALGRGVFFAFPEFSEEREVARFICKDEMPKRAQDDGSIRTITLSQLLALSREVTAQLLPEHRRAHMEEAFTYGLKEYNGFIHGGGKVTVAYRQEESAFFFQPNFEELYKLAKHAVALATTAEAVNSLFVCRGPSLSRSDPGRQQAKEAFLALTAA